MSDQPNPTVQSTSNVPLKRVFKIGADQIIEDTTTVNRTNEQIRSLLKSQYPEVANATIRETVSGDTRYVEFLREPGRKG